MDGSGEVMRSLRMFLWLVAFVAVATLRGACADDFRTGLESLEAQDFRPLHGKRVGVVTNPTGLNRQLRPLHELLARHEKVSLGAIFAPEHGFFGDAAEGVKIGDRTIRGVSVFSLYGKTRRPTPEMLTGLDAVLFDMQDVGVRCYTYFATLKEVMIGCAAAGVEVWVLDRPLPVGATRIAGPVLETGHESFVGPHTTALLHGLTAGEFARLINEERTIGSKLRVVRMQGYRRSDTYETHGQVWVAPSPNIPTVDTARIYAGMVLVEGTNLSEGRGTTRPFHLVGAPWLNARRLADELNRLGLPGCLFRPTVFRPTISKHKGIECQGVELHLTNRESFESVRTGIALIVTVRRLHPEELTFRESAFDRLAGTGALREAIEAGKSHEEIIASWQPALKQYEQRRRKVLIYE